MNLQTCIFFTGVLMVTSLYAQPVELIFSHKLHSESVEAFCTDCHGAADTSAMSSDNLLPDMEVCYNCHDQDTECNVCHKDPDNAVPYPRIMTYIAKFPHTKHVAQNIDCGKCHVNVALSENIMEKHLPQMMACANCHKDVQKVDYCYDCHTTEEDLLPNDHKLDWTKTHGVVQQTNSANCKVCHAENQCLNCHQQDNLDRRTHALNYRNNHGLFAKGNMDNCYTCHEELSFCIDCHQQEFVMPRSHASAGWSNPKTGGRHGIAARIDLDSCLSCHSDRMGEPVCAQCHQRK